MCQSLPAAMAAALGHMGVTPGDVVLAMPSDIDLRGERVPQWVLATPSLLLVLDQAHPENCLFRLPISQAQEFRALAVVGSGLLQVKAADTWLDVVRYSNHEKYYFGRLARRLEQLRKGDKLELSDEDDTDPRRCTVSGILLEYPGQVSPFTVKRSAAVSRVLQLMRPHWRAASIMMTLLVVGVGLDMIGPRLVRYLLDNVLEPKPGQKPPIVPLTGIDTPLELLLMLVASLACVHIVRALVGAANGRIGSRVGTAISFDMRNRLVGHLEQLSLGYYDKQSVGSLVGRVAYDTEAVQGFMGQLTSGFLMQILLVIAAAISMYSLESTLALWTLVPAPLVVGGTLVFWRYVYPTYERFWEQSSKQAGMLNGLLSGIRVVKAFAQEDRELDRFRKTSQSLREARRKVDTSSATFYPLMGLVFGVGGWIVWYVGGHKVLDKAISLGTLIAFFSYLGLFYGPLSNLANLTTWLTQFSTQMHRIFEVLDTPVTIPEHGRPVKLERTRGDLEFRGVTFGYSRLTPVLKNVSFRIDAGQTIGVVGRSGSGKTTLINLISRFYDVDEGQVLIDGIDVRQIGKQDLRRQIGVVLQEPFLFRGTIWDNLTFGRPDATIEQVIASSKAGNSHDFIMRQMLGYDTWVGERGSGLSGGERQRLSLSRALLCEPRVLILDEATSSVDSESELAIQSALAELVKGRTSIIIAHRLSTLRTCDRIMVVDDGRVVESGTHVELMRLDGKYAHLVRLQNAITQTDSVDSLKAQAEHKQHAPPPTLAADPDTGLTPVTGHRSRWLEPGIANIHLGSHNSLHVTVRNERIYQGVFALRCMPVRHPEKYLSLRWINQENREQEVGLIRDVAQWPAEAQTLLREAMQRRYLVQVIHDIESIRRQHGFIFFEATTDHGPAEFVIRWAYESASDFGTGGKILLDVDENRYVVPEVAALPEAARKLFERYIYW
jgi:ATP-binding cassette subfamily B protein